MPRLRGLCFVVPALLIFKDGRIVARHLGITPEATLRAEMEAWSGE
jgi:hypothetical protein